MGGWEFVEMAPRRKPCRCFLVLERHPVEKAGMRGVLCAVSPVTLMLVTQRFRSPAI